MRKENALMFDFSTHYKQMNNAAKLWSKFDIDLMLLKGNKEQVNGYLFHKIHEIANNNFRTLQLLLYVLFLGFRYDRIICLTAPEYYSGKFRAVVYEFIWMIICFLYRKKIELYVKNVSAYKERKLLKLSLKYVNKIWFESNYQKDKFKKHLVLNNCITSKLVTAYLYYSDYNKISKVDMNVSVFQEDKIKVGLLGRFDTKRRDYQMLLDLLDNNPSEDIVFIQIGGFNNTDESKKIRDKYNEIHFIKEFFTSEELDYCLQNCDCLLSMNNESLGYDEGKGTGAFGDAISVCKPLILPEFMSGYSEFVKFCYFYKDSNDLNSIIRSIRTAKGENLNSVFDDFSVDHIKKINKLE